MPESKLNPPSVPIPETAEDDPRLGQLLGRAVERPEDAEVVLVGFPSDEGVRLNGGRAGAAKAPDAIRAALYKLTPDAQAFVPFVKLAERTIDIGNVAVTGDVERDQERLGEALAPHLERGAVSVILGGGHETTYGHFLGYTATEKPVAILNWDAHADVRPRKEGKPHSGSSFRLTLEHSSDLCRDYTVAGLLPHSTALAHLDFVEAHGGKYYWRENLTRNMVNALYAVDAVTHLVSFDLDAVDQGAAPGVSAPAVQGLSAELWLYAAERAGHCPYVQSMDLVELNPRFDTDGCTVRLAALTVWRFLKGLAARRPAD